MFDLMPAMFIGTARDGIFSAQESAPDTAGNAVIERCGVKRNLKLARLGHRKLLLQLTTEVLMPTVVTLH